MPKIYISYSRKDLQIAWEVSAVLNEYGYKTYIDDAPLSAGDNYAQQLEVV